jgi:hypothetical protein
MYGRGDESGASFGLSNISGLLIWISKFGFENRMANEILSKKMADFG